NRAALDCPEPDTEIAADPESVDRGTGVHQRLDLVLIHVPTHQDLDRLESGLVKFLAYHPAVGGEGAAVEADRGEDMTRILRLVGNLDCVLDPPRDVVCIEQQ